MAVASLGWGRAPVGVADGAWESIYTHPPDTHMIASVHPGTGHAGWTLACGRRRSSAASTSSRTPCTSGSADIGRWLTPVAALMIPKGGSERPPRHLAAVPPASVRNLRRVMGQSPGDFGILRHRGMLSTGLYRTEGDLGRSSARESEGDERESPTTWQIGPGVPQCQRG